MGGAALNPEVERIFKKIKFPYLVGYGMTEACPLLAYEHWTKYVPGSCGKPVDVAEVRIDSDDPQHTVGELFRYLAYLLGWTFLSSRFLHQMLP